jgi:hypothetical protein
VREGGKGYKGRNDGGSVQAAQGCKGLETPCDRNILRHSLGQAFPAQVSRLYAKRREYRYRDYRTRIVTTNTVGVVNSHQACVNCDFTLTSRLSRLG